MYNLIVSYGDELLSKNSHIFPKSRFLEYTVPDIAERYRELNDHKVMELLTLPCLFIQEEEENPSRIGNLTSMTDTGSDIIITYDFQKEYPPIKSGKINDNLKAFGLGKLELYRTHWAVKDIDLYDTLINLNLIQKHEIKVPNLSQNTTPQTSGKPKVFIVHGKDSLTTFDVRDFVQSHGFVPIILHEQASQSRTIIEKIEAYSDVNFAIIIYSTCDVGAEKSDLPKLSYRARQNVVFEHGYFIGKLGREKVIALLKDESIEKPNDISGVVYITMDEDENWKREVLKELRV